MKHIYDNPNLTVQEKRDKARLVHQREAAKDEHEKNNRLHDLARKLEKAAQEYSENASLEDSITLLHKQTRTLNEGFITTMHQSGLGEGHVDLEPYYAALKTQNYTRKTLETMQKLQFEHFCKRKEGCLIW